MSFKVLFVSLQDSLSLTYFHMLKWGEVKCNNFQSAGTSLYMREKVFQEFLEIKFEKSYLNIYSKNKNPTVLITVI